MSARFRPRTPTDSPALHPLHSISLQFRRLHLRSIAFRRPQTGETVRTQIVRARKAKWPRDSVRPASNSPRGSARTRHGNNREHGHFPTATFRWRSISPLGKWPTSLIKPNWSDTPLLGYAHGWTRPPTRPPPASLPLRSTIGESDSLASRWRDCAFGKCAHRRSGGVGMKDRRGLRCSFVRAFGLALLSRTEHKSSYIQSRPICRIPLPRDPR